MTTHVEDAERYARSVIAGKTPACKWVRLACQRHLDDLAVAKKKASLYRFDADAANAICSFGELLPHTKGKWAAKGEKIKLQPWQKFILCCLFGWKRRDSGRRKYRKAYIKIPRKNGKSVLAAIIGLWMFAMDGEFGAEVYSGATTEKQAWEVFRPAKLMVERSPELKEAVGCQVWAKSISVPADGSRFEPIIGKPGDGSSPSCAIVDEYHEHDTPDLVDTMETGMGARDQPLLLQITTAGYNVASPCYDQELEARNVLDGAFDLPELFAIMYGLDDGDDWADPAALEKANPNLGVSVDLEFLQAQQRQAVLNPSQQNRFRTKHVNEWCSAKTAWMNLVWWRGCADQALRPADLTGCPAWLVVDLASKIDVAVLLLIFRNRIAGVDHYYLFPRFYLPEDTISEPGPNAQAYQRWHREGLLTATDGAEIDFDLIRDDAKKLMSEFDVQEVVFDPWRATQLAHQLAEDGAVTVEYRQTVQLMSGPMKELESAVKSMRVHHDGNPVLMWMAGNVVAKVDAKDNIYPRKEKPHQKIDGIVATIMGIGRAMTPADQQSFWGSAHVAA